MWTGKKYIIIIFGFLFTFCQFRTKIISDNISLLQCKVYGTVKRYISKNSFKQLVFSGSYYWVVFYSHLKFSNFRHKEKKISRTLSEPSPPKLPLNMTKVICWWSLKVSCFPNWCAVMDKGTNAIIKITFPWLCNIFNCCLTAPQPALGYYWQQNSTHLMWII